MMMQNYQNYQPYNPPYQPQALYQIPYQNTASNTMPGRMVDNFESISVNEVSMDGNASVFLKKDLSEIQVRKWGSDGRIYTTSYKPILDDLSTKQANNQSEELSALNERLQAIEDKIDRLAKPTNAKKVMSDVNT